ncbi:regulator [Zoogloea oleivorans]|uniref:Regulator n=1 Tax=Zoogloea oleivorans TaxID=1552750 RepID=A0A6C2D635_9RHOO|nr:regulator [Zoogloea oleivorans]TYC61526.1 regulator [Zoogloea oleivorans]
MPHFRFDDRAIHWNRLGDFPHLHYTILDVDVERRIADVLFRFAAGEQIVLHRHQALNHTFVVQGEHRLYEADGSLREVRPTGSYTRSPASAQPHREGGGKEEAIVFFSIRAGADDALYELLDDDFQPIGVIGFDTLITLFEAQKVALAA